uniref:Uncharacterized protein n=1 Tax=Prolemur simus TaxID=1328070 RepID=A0A8C9ARB2_PROSS
DNFVRKILNSMSLCLMSYSYLLILLVILLIIYNPLLTLTDYLQSIRTALCYMLPYVSHLISPPFSSCSAFIVNIHVFFRP